MIQVTSSADKENLEQDVDQDIAEFDRWFSATVEPVPLLPAERAIIKTYLAFKLGVHEK